MFPTCRNSARFYQLISGFGRSEQFLAVERPGCVSISHSLVLLQEVKAGGGGLDTAKMLQGRGLFQLCCDWSLSSRIQSSNKIRGKKRKKKTGFKHLTGWDFKHSSEGRWESGCGGVRGSSGIGMRVPVSGEEWASVAAWGLHCHLWILHACPTPGTIIHLLYAP